MPFSLSASYCFSFFTLGRLSGIPSSSQSTTTVERVDTPGTGLETCRGRACLADEAAQHARHAPRREGLPLPLGPAALEDRRDAVEDVVVTQRPGHRAEPCDRVASDVPEPPRRFAVEHGRGRAVPGGAEGRPGERLARRVVVLGVEVRRLDDERPHEGRQSGRIPERHLAVHLSHLDRPVPGVEPEVPPEKRRVGQARRREGRIGEPLEVAQVVERARNAAAGIRARKCEARAREARVRPEPERAVRCEADEQRDVPPQGVEGAHRGAPVGKPDVDVERRLGRPPEQAPDLVRHDRVPAALDQLRRAVRRGRMQPASRERRPCGGGETPQLRKCRRGVTDGRRRR